ncbi:MAG: hypothetical protein AAGA54_30365 [Myxococcota bacterium]
MKRPMLLPLLLAACVPSFEDAPWRVDEARVLAIVAQPPEARPNEVVALTALVADPDGTVSGAPAWQVCTRPRTAEERTGVSSVCLQGGGLEPTAASMTVLSDACARFGPNPPPAEGDAPAQRPADPDPSGGYFVPVQASVADAEGFGAVRVRCDLPGVTRAIFDAFNDRYVANANPAVARLTVDAEPVDAQATVSAGASVSIDVTLSEGAAEPFVRYDASAGQLVGEVEWVRVQWFVTDGTLDRGAVTLQAPARVASATFTAPSDAERVHGWVVLTDARGGSAWRAFELDVVP